MTRPTVSVVIPCYNAEPYLAECLDSVLTQTRPPSEVIVVDDGSTDASCDVARRYPVRLLHTGGQRGHMVARWVGIEAATGDYVAMNDADDVWTPDHLEATAGLLDRFPEAGLAGSNAQMFGTQEGVFEAEIPSEAPGQVFWRAFETWFVPNNSVVVRREALRRAFADYDVADRYASDYLVTLRLAHTHPLVSTGRVTVRWRRHDMQMSVHHWRQRVALHRHRAQFMAQVRDAEDPERVRRMERRALECWLNDVESARNDPTFLKGLLSVRRLVGTVPVRTLALTFGRAHLRDVYESSTLAPVRRLYQLGRRVTGWGAE